MLPEVHGYAKRGNAIGNAMGKAIKWNAMPEKSVIELAVIRSFFSLHTLHYNTV